MNKIYRIITLLFLYTFVAPFSAMAPATPAAMDVGHLDEWAKMYEDMNQQTGGAIEQLMKEMEESGELEKMINEMAASGELDSILHEMSHKSPSDFFKEMGEELPAETAQPSEEEERIELPILEPLKPEEAPAKTAIPELDAQTTKQIKRILQDIKDHLISMRQKAASKRSVKETLEPWDYNLDDLIYYASVIQDDALLKYLYDKEFTLLYQHLVDLQKTLNEYEPLLVIEEFSMEGGDPYVTLGLSASATSEEVEAAYQKLKDEYNPYTIKDDLVQKGVAGEELEKAFKKAQKQSNLIFEAYSRIHQKERSKQAFNTILKALYSTVYQDGVLRDMQTLLKKYDPDALAIKKEQEKKQEEARKKQEQRIKERIEGWHYIPPIFPDISYGDHGGYRAPSTSRAGNGGYSTGTEGGESQPASKSGGGISSKTPEGGKKDGRDKKGKDKDKGKEDKEKGKDEKGKNKGKGKDKDKKELTPPQKAAKELGKSFISLKDLLEKNKNWLNNIFTDQPYNRTDIAKELEVIQEITEKLKDLTKKVNDEQDKLKGIREKEAFTKILKQQFIKNIDTNNMGGNLINILSIDIPTTPEGVLRRPEGLSNFNANTQEQFAFFGKGDATLFPNLNQENKNYIKELKDAYNALKDAVENKVPAKNDVAKGP